jgi:hypothetical protein
MKTIAIDLDDTLNDFTATLQRTEFLRDETHPYSAEVFAGYLAKLRRGADDDEVLLSTEYSFFRAKIHQQCYQRAEPRPGGVAFMRWLRAHDWRIVICTYRDLRRAHDATRAWLQRHGIAFDHLFMAGNKIVFCRAWGIAHLVDDDPFNAVHGGRYGVKVYYPLAGRPAGPREDGARGFHSFEELIPWIQE